MALFCINKLKIKGILIILMVLTASRISSKDSKIRDILLIKDSLECLPYSDIENAYHYIEEGIRLSKKHNNLNTLAYFYGTKGNLLGKSNSDLALKYFYLALKIYEKEGDKYGMGSSYLNIAKNARLTRSEELFYLQKALSMYRDICDSTGILKTYNNIGGYYGSLNMDSSLAYHEKARALSEKIRFNTGLAMYNVNMAVIYLYQDESYYPRVLDHLYKAKHQMPEDESYNIEIERNLMKIYFKMNHIDSALYYYDLISEKFDFRPDIEANTYEFLYGYYLKLQDFNKAILFDKKADSVNEYIRSRNNENQLKLLEMEYNSRLHEKELVKLHAEMQKANTIRIAMATLLILTITFFLILIRWQRQKAKKKQYIIEQHRKRLEERKKRLEMEQQLLSTELEHSEYKRKYLYDELKYTNRELSSFATGIIQNHMLWDDVRARIKEISQEKKQDNVRAMLRELDTMLLQVFGRNEQRYEFIQRSRQLNHSVVFYLKNNYECLTEKDINLLILILLKFTPKEMAVLCNIELTSIKKSRHRIRKKMGLPSEETIEMFFERVISEIEMKEAG